MLAKAPVIEAMAITPRALLREKGTPCVELSLADPKWNDGELINFMMAHPILINYLFVVTPLGTKLCRPSEAVSRTLNEGEDTSEVTRCGAGLEEERARHEHEQAIKCDEGHPSGGRFRWPCHAGVTTAKDMHRRRPPRSGRRNDASR